MDLFGRTSEDGASRSDGAGDRGIDWFHLSEQRVEIWQFKCPAEVVYEKFYEKIEPKSLTDLSRIIDWIENLYSGDRVQNKRVFNFQGLLRSTIERLKTNETPTLFITINFVAIGSELTEQAADELKEIHTRCSVIQELNGVLVEISINTVFTNDVLEEIWKTLNTGWVTSKKSKKDTAEIRLKERTYVDDKRCQIFYARAVDFIHAYNDFGYKLFEPNVRCYLQSSGVNQAIRESLETEKGIKNFQYLNNGITLIYESIVKKDGKLTFRKPGVVNGLQTIKTLAAAHREVGEDKVSLIEENCFVMVRAFAKSTGIPVEDLVISTNNQNRMNPRNLKSNSNEQKLLESRFAELGWFYERKEGAWEAFSEDEQNWTSLPGKKATHFGGKERKNRKVLDNEFVAVSWLSFSGYSDIARNEKTKIFDNERLYNRCFNLRQKKHGYDYDYERNAPLDDESNINETQSSSVLLLASVINLTVKNLLPNKISVERKYVDKLSLSQATPEEQKAELIKDPEYLAELMMASCPLTFIEMFGFIFFQSNPDSHSALAKRILKESDLKEVFEAKDFNPLNEKIYQKTLEKKDVFTSVYKMWNAIWQEFATSSNWRTELLSNSSRPSFGYGLDNRKNLLNRVNEFHEISSTNGISKPWSSIFDEHKKIKGILDYF